MDGVPDAPPGAQQPGMDDFMIPGDGAVNIGDLQPCPSSMQNYCFLCKFGASDGAATDVNVNRKVKMLQEAIDVARKTSTRSKLVEVVEALYQDWIMDSDEFCDEPEWERSTIEEHLFVHEAQACTAKGESLVSYVIEDVLLATRHAFKHMYNAETGMPDATMSKQAMNWLDRLLKCDTRNTTSAAAQSRKKKDGMSDGGFR